MDTTFHYPPDLMHLLIDTIPLLCPTKKDVLLFFRGAGVNADLMNDVSEQVQREANSISKYEITRTIVSRVNERGDATLQVRREILKRVTEFEDFSTCWDDDRLKAMGLVGQIRKVVDVKDSFTRMNIERENERKQRLAQKEAKELILREKRAALVSVHLSLAKLFALPDPHRRGKALEKVINDLFKISGISVREAFTLTGNNGEGIIEQIDGVVEFDGHVYLVEMKWWDKTMGVGEVSHHLVRLYSRKDARGILISASDYSEPAITICRDALSSVVMVLCKLEEIVRLGEMEGDLKQFLRDKVNAAIVDKQPLYEPLKSGVT